MSGPSGVLSHRLLMAVAAQHASLALLRPRDTTSAAYAAAPGPGGRKAALPVTYETMQTAAACETEVDGVGSV